MKHSLKITALLVLGAALPVYAGAGLPSLANIYVGPYHVTVLGDSAQLHTGTNTLSIDIYGSKQPEFASLHLMGPAGEIVEVPLKPLLVLGDPEAGHGGGHGDDNHGGDSHHNAAPKSDSNGSGVLDLDVVNQHDVGHGSADTAHTDVVAGHGLPAPAAPSHAHTPETAHPAPVAPVQESAAMHEHAVGLQLEQQAMPASAEALANVDATADNTADPDAMFRTSVRGRVTLATPGTWTAQLIVQDGGRSYSTGAPLTAVESGPNKLYLGATGLLMLGSMAFGAIRRRITARGKGRR